VTSGPSTETSDEGAGRASRSGGAAHPGRRRLALVVVLVVVLAVGAGVSWWRADGGAPPDPRSAARTSLPGLVPATGEPTLASLATVRPGPGQVVQAAGPFDDRFELTALAFADDRTAVTGTATLGEVSALLEFEALAGFYDRKGALLATARDVYHADESAGHHDEGQPDRTHDFRVEVPAALRDVVVSAAVGVPVLVNE
jgi:hypothetical protein